jgi:DNA invertase Pin-like site-specific DNA recombinase
MGTQRRIGISYSRFSDPKQAKGDSGDRQERLFRTFCDRHRLRRAAEVFADRGRSGYRDEHRKKGQFGQLVALAKEGRFEPGTVIVVEAWDRLGRLRPDKQTELLSELLRTGVSIGVCRLDDIFTEEDFGTHKFTTLSVFVQLAYHESKQKAERIAASWEKRRQRARSSRALMTRQLPAWLTVVNGSVVPVPERVAALQRIFALSAAGYGRTRIVRTLTEENVQPFGSEKWTRPYVSKILSDRRVLGEFQPRKTDDTPEGPPLPHYYPEVIRQEQYLLARAGQDGRRGRGGRRDRRHVNVFQSLLTHASDRGGFFLHNHGTGQKPQLVLTTAESISGRARSTFTFPYPVFEEAILSCLSEVDPRDVLPSGDDAERSKLDALRVKLRNVKEQVRQLQEDLAAGYSKAVATVLREQEALEELVAGELQDEQARTAKPAAAAWRELPGLAKLVRDGGDPVRLKLRLVLRRVAERLWVLITRDGCRRLAAVQVRFHGGGQREYLIQYSAPARNRPGWWRVASLRSPFGVLDPESPASIGIAPFDLSDAAGVERTEMELSAGGEYLEGLFEGSPTRPMP